MGPKNLIGIHRRQLLVACAPLTLSACATQTNRLGTGELVPDKETGYLAASIAFNVINDDSAKTWIQRPSIHTYVKHAATGKNTVLSTATDANATGLWFKPELIIDEGWRRRVELLVPVASGEYELGHIESMFLVSGGFTLRKTLSNPPRIVVTAGAVSYLGCIELTFTVGKNFFGRTVPSSGSYRLIDEFNTDMPAIKKIEPRVEAMPVVNLLRRQ